jgi:hypothetical protein
MIVCKNTRAVLLDIESSLIQAGLAPVTWRKLHDDAMRSRAATISPLPMSEGWWPKQHWIKILHYFAQFHANPW